MIEIGAELYGSGEVFAELAHTHRVRRHAEARELVLIASACDTWQVDEAAVLPGSERCRPGGAEGTTSVGDFLCLELAGILQVSPEAAAATIADTLNLRDRHPSLWHAVQRLTVAPWQARHITARCAAAGLSLEAAHWVDRRLADALALMPFGRALRLLEGLIVKADPALAAERAERARAARYARLGDHRDGNSLLVARIDTLDACTLDETITDVANALAARGDTRPTDQRRAAALGWLAEPARAAALLAGAPLPDSRRATTVVLHLPAGSVASAEPGVIARLDGIGPLTRDALIDFLGTRRVSIRPVVDLNAVEPVDSYEIPGRLRDAVLARHPVEAFPWSNRRSHGCDLDHTIPFDHVAPPGSRQTRVDNLAPLRRLTHRGKTHGGWKVRQPHPGVLLWTSPHGYVYVVTPHGTTPLGRQGTTTSQRSFEPNTLRVDYAYPAA